MNNSKMNQQNKIMYSNKDYFEIIPNLSKKDTIAYKKYFDNIKNTDKRYFNNVSSECDNNDYFFWTIDYENSIIISNKATLVVFSDIINQLAMLLYWIFENEYTIVGSYVYRSGFTIGSITIDNSKKIINHTISLDKINIDELTNISDPIIENLMDCAIKKINNAKSNQPKINPVKKIISKENALIIESMQNRLINVENKMKSYDKFNIFILKYCTVIGLLTAGSIIIMYSLSTRDTV